MNANVGMLYPVFAQITAYTPGTSITYGTGMVVDEARAANVQWQRSDGEFYGDDALLDTDNGVTGYTIDFEATGIHDAVRNKMLGEEIASSEYEITDAAAPDGGFGYIRKMRDNSGGTVAITFEAWWFRKVKFSLTSEESRTKEGNTEWRTPTINGKGMGVRLTSAEKLSFATHETFTSFSAAQTWLKAKANIT